jgi:hypothetical protein
MASGCGKSEVSSAGALQTSHWCLARQFGGYRRLQPSSHVQKAEAFDRPDVAGIAVLIAACWLIW